MNIFAALFVITKKLETMQSHSMDEWNNYTVGCHSAINRKGLLIHTATALDESQRMYAE